LQCFLHKLILMHTRHLYCTFMASDLCVTSVSTLVGALILSKTFKNHGKVIYHPPHYPDSSHTSEQGNVCLLGVKWASGQPADLFPIKLQVIQLNKRRKEIEKKIELLRSYLHCTVKMLPCTLTSHLLRAKQQPDCHVDLINSVTYPVVTAHGVETICSTDEHKIIISRNQDFNEIMALVLRGREDSEIYDCFSAVNTTMTADFC